MHLSVCISAGACCIAQSAVRRAWCGILYSLRTGFRKKRVLRYITVYTGRLSPYILCIKRRGRAKSTQRLFSFSVNEKHKFILAFYFRTLSLLYYCPFFLFLLGSFGCCVFFVFRTASWPRHMNVCYTMAFLSIYIIRVAVTIYRRLYSWYPLPDQSAHQVVVYVARVFV